MLLWMGVIFSLSHRSGDKIKNNWDWWHLLFNWTPFGPDKIAHFLINFILGLFAHIAAPKRPWTMLIICSVYGITDEIHQIFIPKRSCDLMDWVADTIGAACSIWGLQFIQRHSQTTKQDSISIN